MVASVGMPPSISRAGARACTRPSVCSRGISPFPNKSETVQAPPLEGLQRSLQSYIASTKRKCPAALSRSMASDDGKSYVLWLEFLIGPKKQLWERRGSKTIVPKAGLGAAAQHLPE